MCIYISNIQCSQRVENIRSHFQQIANNDISFPLTYVLPEEGSETSTLYLEICISNTKHLITDRVAPVGG